MRIFSFIVAAILIFIGAVWRFYLIGDKTIWLDEAFSIWLADYSLIRIWFWLIQIDQHPPLYYSLLHYWQIIFGDLQGAVRAFSALCSTLALPYIYGATRRFLNSTTALLTLLILAFSPFHIRFAQEARMYGLLTLCAAAALYYLARILMDYDPDLPADQQPHQPWKRFILAQTAVMLTHNTATIYFPIALNVAMWGAIWLKRRSQQSSSLPSLNDPAFGQRWLISQGSSLMLWAFWSIPFLIQTAKVDKEFWIGPPNFGTVFMTLHNFNLAFLPNWTPWAYNWNLLYWILAILGFVWIWRRQAPARALFLLTLFVLPMIIGLLVSLRRPIFYDRTLIWITLPYYMLLAAGISSIGRTTLNAIRRPAPQALSFFSGLFASVRMIIQLLLVFLIVWLSTLSLSNYYNHFEKEDWAKAADYVATRMEPGDMIIFNATWVQIPFQYYLRNYAVDAELKGLPVDMFDRGVLEPKMAEEDIPYMKKLLRREQRVWLVYSHDWYTDPTQIIPRELENMMRRTDYQEFVGLRIMAFERE